MRLRIINDIHVFGVNPTHTFDEIVSAAHTSPYPCYFLGDIVDLKKCKKDDLNLAMTSLQLLSENFNFIRGNHELNAVKASDGMYIESGTIFLTHGDVPQWGYEKSLAFRQKKAGAGALKRLLSKLIDGLRHLHEARPSQLCLDWIAREKERNPNLRWVVMGHSHPTEHIFFKYAGVNAVILKRGINDIELA